MKAKWNASLALGLAARALANGYSKEHILDLLCDIEKYVGETNLPSIKDYYCEVKQYEIR